MEADLKRLSKQELIDIIENLNAEIEKLKAENAELQARAGERELRLESCGSIAEAAMAVNDVFDKAQAAADIYLENIKRMQAETAESCAMLERKAEVRAEEIISSAEKQSDELLQAAVVHANEAINRAASICAEKLGEAEAVLKSAHQDSADIRDAALRFFMERSANAPLHLKPGTGEIENIIPGETAEDPEPADNKE